GKKNPGTNFSHRVSPIPDTAGTARFQQLNYFVYQQQNRDTFNSFNCLMKTLVCLLIDDDAEEAEIFHYALEEFSSSVKCVSASSGKEAIAYLTKHPGVVDYIFLDMNMPRMSGLECLTQLKKMGLSASVPI